MDQSEKQHLIDLGKRIRELRESKGFNQTEFANLIGKDQPSLARIENGNINTGYLTLIHIAHGLGVKVGDLV